ncbi:MAG: hypothetical protein ACUZ8N_08915 [Candidatus Scalindua sp.]
MKTFDSSNKILHANTIELLDIMDEVTDSETMKTIREGRKAISTGTKGIQVSEVLGKAKKRVN